MLYTYIISKDVVNNYFPQVSESENYEEGGDATTVLTDLVCVKSNKWIDVKEKDKYIPFTFTLECEIDSDRLELIKAYIENRTNTKGIYFSPSRILGSPECEYFCYIGDDSLYVTEADSYDMKEEMNIFKKGDRLFADSECEGKCLKKCYKLEGRNIWFGNHQESLLQKGEDSLGHHSFFHKSKLGCDILGIHDNYNGEFFSDLLPYYKTQMNYIDRGKLPSVVIEKKKWIDMINCLLKKEDPIYTPITLMNSLREGRFSYGSHEEFMNDLKNVKDSPNVKIYVTEDPLDIVYSLKMNDINYVMFDNDDLFEIVAECDQLPEYVDNHESLTNHIKDSCKNHDEILQLSGLEQLNVFIDDDYGIKLDKDDMIFVNPYTGNMLPSNIIHSIGTLHTGIQIPIENYDPHKNIHIDVPIKIEIDRNDDRYISIHLKTHQEECCIEDKFPQHSCDHKDEDVESLIRKLWIKGYLLDELGLVSILYHDRMEKGCIRKPWWFQYKNHSQANDLLKFISSL